jgi:hypothetical protein
VLLNYGIGEMCHSEKDCEKIRRVPSVGLLQDIQLKVDAVRDEKIMTKLWLDVIYRLSVVLAMNGYSREIGRRPKDA